MTFYVPVPSGPPSVVTTEMSYAAFPVTVKTASGAYLCFYQSAPTHNATTGEILTRRSTDGIAWSGPESMVGQSPGYKWGFGGIACESAAQGGRVHMLVLRLHITSQTVDEVRCWAKWSEDDGLTWTLGPQMPVVSAPGWYPSNLIVCANGDLVAAGYTTDGYARYFRSADRGASWAACGTAKPGDRGCGEPTLVQLPDGRIVSFLRSDAPTERLYRTIRDENLSTGDWAAPIVASYDASGLPSAAVVTPEGHVAVLYRGWADRTNPALGRPTRLMMFAPDAGESGLFGYRANIDPQADETGRYLYGNLILAADGWRAIVGVEGPGGQAGGSAQVVSIPLELRPI